MFFTSESLLKQTFIIDDDDAAIFQKFDSRQPISSITFETFSPFVKNYPFVDYESFVEHSMHFNEDRQQICIKSKKTGQDVFSCDLPDYKQNVENLSIFAKSNQSMFDLKIVDHVSASFIKKTSDVILVGFSVYFVGSHPTLLHDFYLSINDFFSH